MKKLLCVLGATIGLLIIPFASAQSLPTLFHATLSGHDAWAYLSDYFEIYWPQTFQSDLQIRGGQVVKTVSSPRDVPQQVLWIGNHLEEARRMVVGVMGYRHPVGALNNKLPVVVDKLPGGLYGFASIRDDGTPYMVVNPLLDDQLLKSTLAHEYFHTVQFGYDETTHLLYQELETNEPFRIPTKMAEGTALWVMNRAFPDSTVYHNFFDQSAFKFPYLGIFGNIEHTEGGAQTTYGTFLWYHFLSQKFGDQIVQELWEEHFQLSKLKEANKVPFSTRAYRAHENVFLKQYDTDLKSVFEEFLIWNALPEKYRETIALPDLDLSFESMVLPVTQRYTEGTLPEAFGANYIKISTQGKFDRLLRFEFDGAPQGSYSVMMIPFKNSKGIEDKIVRTYSEAGVNTTLELELESYDFVLIGIGVSGMSEEVLSRKDPFSAIRYQYGFQATLVDPLLDAKQKMMKTEVPNNTESVMPETALQVEEVGDPPVVKAELSFPDVIQRHPYADGIEALFRDGIVTGYSDGHFRPQQTVNRAEMTKIVLNAAGIIPLKSDRRCFPDVTTEWFAPFVCAAKRLRIVGGFPDGRFGPADEISVAAAYKIVLETWFDNISEPAATSASDSRPWFLKYLEFAERKGVLHSARIFPSKAMNRGEMAQLVWQVRGLIDK